MNKKLIEYIEDNIIPIYRKMDAAHRPNHVRRVIKHAMEIAADFDVNQELVYVIAAYHDIGMQFGRENHHLTGGEYLENDLFLNSIFSKDTIKTMKQAIEDHRASNDIPPRSIYGKIIAEADRDIHPDIVLKRTVQFGLNHHPELSFDAHFERVYHHIKEKYGPQGYLKLWLKTKRNQDGLKMIHKLLENDLKMKDKIKLIFDRENSKK
ncbi:MAG: HD domain-containing protein [Acholeplasmataceae bacterium]|nr:HD domain-containing protein [Acholeplasmataceae bacterium]